MPVYSGFGGGRAAGGGSYTIGAGGIADYNDASTSATPIVMSAGTWTTVTNDGQGAATNTQYLPKGVDFLMDLSTGQFDFSQLDVGDNCFIRNDFSVTPQTNNALLELRYQLGTGAGSYVLQTIVGRLDSGSGQPYRFSLSPHMVYLGDLNTKDNPITLQLKLSTNGTLINAGSAVGVSKL